MRITKLASSLLAMICCLSMSSCCCRIDTTQPIPAKKFDNVIKLAESKLEKTFETQTDRTRFPRSTDQNGRWLKTSSKEWTSGFWPGCLWYMYELTNNNVWKKRAETCTEPLEVEKNNIKTHDVGFMMFCSFGNGYKLTGNKQYKPVILKSAESLATRFNTKVGCTRSWNNAKWHFPVIIDNMMNLELLFWASKNGGEKTFRDIAITHSLTTMKNHIRPDYSTFHLVDYDPNTGDVIKKQTHQGYADDSCWARGQAWGVYGFTMAYRETRDERFLTTAQNLADYFIAHLPADYVPYWDFQAPNIPNEPKDTSAAAIAASGLLELSTFTSEPSLKKKYFDAAGKILENLASPTYLDMQNKTEAILLHAVGNKPAKKEVDVPLIYGDYYFLEAIARYYKITGAIN